MDDTHQTDADSELAQSIHDSLLSAARARLHPTRRVPPAVLVVDGDTDASATLTARLRADGYRVFEASDSESALMCAIRVQPDAAIVDVALPDIDGWGVLAAITSDARMQECKTILTSDRRDWLFELYDVDIGADRYAEKSPGLAGTVTAALARRFGILRALPFGVWGPLSDVGAQSLLAGACELRVRGMLTVDTVASMWRITFDDGIIAGASARVDGLVLADEDALLALLEAPDAPFVFEPLADAPERSLALPWSDVAPSVLDEVNGRRARARRGLTTSRSLVVDGGRLAAWARLAPSRAVAIGRAIAEGTAPRDLIAGGEHAPLLVDAVVEDLARRGVITS